jgi:hypothetical protein
VNRKSPKKDPPEPPAHVECADDDRMCTWSGTEDELVEIDGREFENGVIEYDLGCPDCGTQVGPTRIASEPDLV